MSLRKRPDSRGLDPAVTEGRHARTETAEACAIGGCVGRDTSETTTTRVASALLFAAACAQIWAAFHLQGLAEDGAYCLRVLLNSHRPSCLEPARLATQLLLQAPVLAAARAGITDKTVLEVLFSLPLQLAPLLLVALCLAVLPAGRRGFCVFPIAAYFAGASSVDGFGLIEGPTATFYFWLMFYRILFAPEKRGPEKRGPEKRGAWLTAALAAPALFAHEIMMLLAPLAVAACCWRARSAEPAFRRFMSLLAAWFVFVAVVQAGHVILPHNLINRDDYAAGLWRLRWVAVPGAGVNTAALLGLAAAATMLAAWWRGRVAPWFVTGFAIVACAAASAVWLSPWLRATIPLYYARDHPAFVSIPLALAALGALASRGVAVANLAAPRHWYPYGLV